jgi:hypothetical protein
VEKVLLRLEDLTVEQRVALKMLAEAAEQLTFVLAEQLKRTV